MIIFPDTNILIHFKPIQNWDWDSEKGADFQIGLCMCIVNELDKIKYSASTNSTKRRIQETVKKLSTSVDYIFNNIPFIIIVPDRLSEYLQNLNLDKDDKDDVFIATVLGYKNKNPNIDICIVSNDLGVQLKCKANQINYKIPPEEYLIQEDDAATKEIKKLSTELNRITNLQPKLKLQFDDGATFKKFNVNEPRREYETVIANEMERIKTENPFLEPETDKNPLELSLFNLYKKTPEKVVKYNEVLKEYYTSYEVYLHKTKVSFYKKDLTLILYIEISNLGNTPGEDIDLYMHFPDGFTLSKKDEYYSKEREPTPPELSMYSLAPFDMSQMMPHFPFHKLPDIDLRGFSITKSNSYDVKDHFKSIKHNHIGTVYPLYITFDRFEDVQSFDITCKITAANMVDMIEGKISVIVTKISDSEIGEN